MAISDERENPGLLKALGTFHLTLYGVGVIVGAGIYVLLGRVVAIAGNAAWLGFVAAAVAALPTGLSYAELSSRYPRSAGEAVFTQRAFGKPWLSFLVGYLILASGVASTAAVSRGFAQYFLDLTGAMQAAPLVVALLFLVALTWLNHRGIEASAWVNTVCVAASVGALLILIGAGVGFWGRVDLLDVAAPEPGASGSGLTALLSAGALAFYAFIGFEDICNVAEETREPHRTIPRGILLSVALSTLLYVGVAITAVNVVGAPALVSAEVPLVALADALTPGWPAGWLNVVAFFALTNTALLNLIMSSRILYGMANQGWIPARFAEVHPRRRSPTWGVLAALLLAAGTAASGVLTVLAEATNVVILAAFFAVNAALLGVKWRKVPPDDDSRPHFRVPAVVPMLGLLTTVILVVRFSPGAYLRAGALLVVGALLYWAPRWVRSRSEPRAQGT